MEQTIAAVAPYLLTLLVLALVALLGVASAYAYKRLGGTALGTFIGWALDLAKSAVQHVEGGLKLELQALTKDGELSKDDLRKLRQEAARLVMEWGGQRLKEGAAQFFPGAVGEGFVQWVISLVERAVGTMPNKIAPQVTVHAPALQLPAGTTAVELAAMGGQVAAATALAAAGP